MSKFLGDVLKLDSDNKIDILDNKQYRISGVQNYGQGIVIRREVSGKELTMKKYQIIKNNQLMWCKVDTKSGAFGLTKNEHVGSLASTNMALANIDTEQIIPDFLEMLFQNKHFHEHITKYSSGSTNRKYLTPKQLFDLIEIPDLTIDEQKKFLNKVNNLKNSGLSDEIDTQQSLLKQLKQTILQEAIEGKLTVKWRVKNPDIGTAKELLEQIKTEKEKLIKEKKIKQGKKQTANEIENLDIEIPDSWLLVDLDDITQYITDGTHQTPRYVENGRMFLSAQNVKPFKFMPEIYRCVSEEDYQKYIANRQTEKGDLLLGRVGAGIGETAVVDQDLEFAIYVSLGLVKTFKQFTNPEYLATVFNSPYGVRYAKGNISSGGGSAGNFNLGRIRSFPIPFPPLEEQKKIVATIEKLFTLCNELESEINQNKITVDNLMATVFKEAFKQ